MRPPSAHRTLPTLSTILALLLLAVPVHSAYCSELTVGGALYDLTPLAGVRTATKESDTPPTTSEARVVLDLCAEGGLPRQDGVAEEDQCPEGTRACLTMINHKKSASDPDRITAVIPLWTGDAPDSQVRLKQLGKNGEAGLNIDIQGPEYAGSPKNTLIDLICDTEASDPNPTLEAYESDLLILRWATPDACPRSGSSPGSPSSGMGFFGFIKLLFWLSVIGLVAYFAIGMFYNHQQYSARGWDLVPHRDFWREFPVLVQDLVSHVIAGLRGQSGGGGRGGYSSLG